MPPKFWQFYARGVMWTGVVLFPLMMLYDYFQSLEIIVPLIEPALASIFALGFVLIDFVCGFTGICLLSGMTTSQKLFFAYFVSVLAFGFVVALYLAWTWTPKKIKVIKSNDE